MQVGDGRGDSGVEQDVDRLGGGPEDEVGAAVGAFVAGALITSGFGEALLVGWFSGEGVGRKQLVTGQGNAAKGNGAIVRIGPVVEIAPTVVDGEGLEAGVLDFLVRFGIVAVAGVAGAVGTGSGGVQVASGEGAGLARDAGFGQAGRAMLMREEPDQFLRGAGPARFGGARRGGWGWRAPGGIDEVIGEADAIAVFGGQDFVVAVGV